MRASERLASLWILSIWPSLNLPDPMPSGKEARLMAEREKPRLNVVGHILAEGNDALYNVNDLTPSVCELELDFELFEP